MFLHASYICSIGILLVMHHKNRAFCIIINCIKCKWHTILSRERKCMQEKQSTSQELFTVAECPSHPSESLTSDTWKAYPALSLFHLPILAHTTDTCHILVTGEDRVEANTEKHGPSDKRREFLHGNPCSTESSSQTEPLKWILG